MLAALEARLHALERQAARDYEQIEKMTAMAKNEVDRRLEGMNELRSQIQNERQEYVRRDRMEALLEAADRRIQGIEQFMYNLQGRMTVTGIGLTLLVTLLSLAMRFFVK